MPKPVLSFDEALPITAAVSQLRTLLAEHQVVVVAGETGSGKTTQLPKIAMLAGRKRIGHTQPRRIAARSVAERIAQEMGEELGQTVGYQVRFTQRTSRHTAVKVMTDGILLAEIAHDPMLRRYDTLIIDEAHERSLNIDFLLGYLKQLLPKRPDLTLIVTSATIDTQRFAAHFDDAPVLEISGRTYPVEVRYRPVREEGSDADLIDSICAAVRELDSEREGDILVFCSGEREIRDAAEAINALQLRFTEVLPLYARLSAAEQHRIFTPHTGRRIVLATNVAETSLTVPGIRYVIDPGFARISRYSARTKVQRLPIEAISQASANQRAGRCGRLGPGICLRLYSEEDFLARPEFTEPEILRTNLASVILQMAQAKLGEIADFPFLEAPDSSQVRDGIRLLTELGALADGGGHGVRLTEIGQRLARLPVDPRLGRMLIEAERQGCLREVQAVVAGLAIPDVRERPAEHQQAAEEAHRRFWAPLGTGEPTPDGSDIAALLRLWEYLKQRRAELSGNAFRRMCRSEFLHLLRVREWQDLHSQLKQACRDLGMNRNTEPAGLDRVHLSVLSGLLSHVGLLDISTSGGKPPQGQRPQRRKGPAEYLGARGARFAINPGSSAAKTRAELVMAVELVETSRLWARTVAPITAEQIEQVGGHLLRRSYSEPRWSERSGQCVATEKVTLLGIPVIAGRTVSYGRIDPEVAREVFLTSALAEGRWRTRHHFWKRNEATRAEAEEVAERTRRYDLLLDDAGIAAWYAERIPENIVSVGHFDRWWRTARQEDEHLLDLSVDDLLIGEVDDDQAADYPTTWHGGDGLDLGLDYAFEPGAGHDGVTVNLTLDALHRVDPAWFSWQVPGLRHELVTALIRGLPKQLRARLVPAPDTAAKALAWLGEPAQDEALTVALSRAILALSGLQVPAQAWSTQALPDHLRMRFRVTRPQADPVIGRDLAALQQDLGEQLSTTLNAAADHITHPGATTWAFGDLPEQITTPVLGFPALSETPAAVGVRIHPDLAQAQSAHRRGLERLIALTSPDPTHGVVSRLTNPAKLALATSAYPDVPALLADARLRAISDLLATTGSVPWKVRDEVAFTVVRDLVRAEAAPRMQQVSDAAATVLALAAEIRVRLPGVPAATSQDITEQLAGLVYQGFVRATPASVWPRLPVYLRAVHRRLDALATNPRREREAALVIGDLEDDYAVLCASHASRLPSAVAAIGWQLEELRVSLFAQALGTAGPVSAKRVAAAIAALS